MAKILMKGNEAIGEAAIRAGIALGVANAQDTRGVDFLGRLLGAQLPG